MNPPRPTLRAWTQRYVIALGVVFVLTVGGVVGANVVIDSSLAGISRVHLRTADLPGTAEGGNYLLIGSDTRSFVKSAADAQKFGGKDGEPGQRSDTMMVVHVDPDQKKALVVSIPRDLVVDVPGVGRTKINAAFAQANSVQEGAQKVIDTLKANFGLDIHHFVEVDFESFRGVVNAIGTVHIYFPNAVRDVKTGLSVENPGCVALNGSDSLDYVRSRYLEAYVNGKWVNASPRADLDRIERQQEFVRRLGAVAFRKAVKNPLTAKNVADAVVPNLTMDDSFGTEPDLRAREPVPLGRPERPEPGRDDHVPEQALRRRRTPAATPTCGRRDRGSTQPARIVVGHAPSPEAQAEAGARSRPQRIRDERPRGRHPRRAAPPVRVHRGRGRELVGIAHGDTGSLRQRRPRGRGVGTAQARRSGNPRARFDDHRHRRDGRPRLRLLGRWGHADQLDHLDHRREGQGREDDHDDHPCRSRGGVQAVSRAVSASSRSRLRAFTHRYVIALGVALVFTISGVVGANLVIDSKFEQISRVKVKLAAADPGTPGNFLLIGSDTRAFESNDQQAAAFGSKDEQTGQRSDTIMVVHVEPDSRTSVVVSFPRDLYVDIPGVGKSKINAAFNDGPQKVIDTLQANFGIPINHYLEVDFASFQGIVDAVGKVPVYLPAEARDEKTGFSVPAAGCYQLNGEQALQYVRSRYLQYYDPATEKWTNADAIPDIGRIARQQNFIRRIGSLAYRSALSNPLKATELADKVIPKLVVDSTLERGDVFKLVNTFRTIDPSDPNSVEMLTLPTYGDTLSDGQQVLLPDQPDADTMLARLRTFNAPVTPPAGILPAQVRVRVLNGSGHDGVASTTLDALQREFGFAGAGLGNASRVAKTEVRYRPGIEKAARLVKSYLGGVGKVVQDPGIADADVVVVLGSDFTAVSAPPGVAAAPTSSTSTTIATPITVTPGGTEVNPDALRKAEEYIRGLHRGLAEAGCVL